MAEIGHDGPANHGYDLTDFYNAVSAGNFPAISFIKAAAYQDGHAGYSDPRGRADVPGVTPQLSAAAANLE
jgi:phospholipase C